MMNIIGLFIRSIKCQVRVKNDFVKMSCHVLNPKILLYCRKGVKQNWNIHIQEIKEVLPFFLKKLKRLLGVDVSAYPPH